MVVYWLRHRGTAYPVHRGDCILGRAPHCFIVLSAEQVSREHAVVRAIDDRLEVEDLGSRNGVLINGRPVEVKGILNAGDVLEIGSERLDVLRRMTRDQSETEQRPAPEHPAARAQRNILELIEELAARASDSPDRSSMVTTIHGLVDTLVQSTERSGRPLNRGEAIRLVSVARVIAQWAKDDRLSRWSDDIARALGQ